MLCLRGFAPCRWTAPNPLAIRKWYNVSSRRLRRTTPACVTFGYWLTHWMENCPEPYSTPSLPATNTSHLRPRRGGPVLEGVAGTIGAPFVAVARANPAVGLSGVCHLSGHRHRYHNGISHRRGFRVRYAHIRNRRSLVSCRAARADVGPAAAALGEHRHFGQQNSCLSAVSPVMIAAVSVPSCAWSVQLSEALFRYCTS